MPTEFSDRVAITIESGLKRMDLFWDVIEGRASRDALKSAATRYYAEVKTFIDLKLPERMRLCPSDALFARRFLCRIYADEHGDFEEGRDHPSLWAKFCRALGIEQHELDREYQEYARRFRYMRDLEPSRENMVTELATMAAWESVVPRLAELPFKALRDRYAIPEDALEFFSMHQQVDEVHATVALSVLVEAATTPALQDRAIKAIEGTLDLESYFA